METWRNLPAVAARPRVVNRLDRPGPPAPDGAAAVVCQAIVKDFELGNGSSLRALDNVSFSLPAGGLTMLSGPSGCGKSTLLSIISGILKATSGEVSIFGTVAGRMKDRDQVAFRRQATGFVFQQYNLLAALSARENAAVPLIAAGWRRAEALAASDAVLTQLGMARFAGALPRQLSGGQQQRVAIARAMVHSPRLVLCDEPTAALDAANGRVLMQLLRAVALAPERAVIVVTHDSRIFEFADRIITMEDGRIKHLNHAAAMPTAASGF